MFYQEYSSFLHIWNTAFFAIGVVCIIIGVYVLSMRDLEHLEYALIQEVASNYSGDPDHLPIVHRHHSSMGSVNSDFGPRLGTTASIISITEHGPFADASDLTSTDSVGNIGEPGFFHIRSLTPICTPRNRAPSGITSLIDLAPVSPAPFSREVSMAIIEIGNRFVRGRGRSLSTASAARLTDEEDISSDNASVNSSVQFKRFHFRQRSSPLMQQRSSISRQGSALVMGNEQRSFSRLDTGLIFE